jgi:hypothetical protein
LNPADYKVYDVNLQNASTSKKGQFSLLFSPSGDLIEKFRLSSGLFPSVMHPYSPFSDPWIGQVLHKIGKPGNPNTPNLDHVRTIVD